MSALSLMQNYTYFDRLTSNQPFFFVISWSEAEEETGSAEEQPVSNRFLHYTETVFMGEGILRSALALSFQAVPHG